MSATSVMNSHCLSVVSGHLEYSLFGNLLLFVTVRSPCKNGDYMSADKLL